MDEKLQVGDIVYYAGFAYATLPKCPGVIIAATEDEEFLVEFDLPFKGGHDGAVEGVARGKAGHCWYIPACSLARAPKSVDQQHLPSDAADRKGIPLCAGVFDYFPNALVAVAALSKKGNDQHNPGQPLHWARGKSTDHADCILRHQLDRGGIDTDGVRHSTKVAWRALAQLEEELIKDGKKPGRGTK